MAADLNPYEQQREDRLKRNTDVMIQMGILTAASALSEAVLKSKRQGVAAKVPKSAERPPSEPSVSAEPARRSCRLKGEARTLQPIERKESHRHVTVRMLLPLYQDPTSVLCVDEWCCHGAELPELHEVVKPAC